MSKLHIDVPNAAEARASVERGAYDKAQLQALLVAEAIKKAISEGKTSTGGEGTLEPFVKNELEAMGYTCKTGQQHNEVYWSISW